MDIRIVDDEKFSKSIDMICRHTNYDKKIAEEKLKENPNVENILKEYLGGVKKTNKEVKSVNELIHKEMRDHFK
jgi:hypothetical protein